MSARAAGNLLNEQITSRLADSDSMRRLLQGIRAQSLPLRVRGPKSAFCAYLAARIHGELRAPLLLIVPHESEIRGLQGDLALFGINSSVLPALGTGAYSEPSPHSSVWGERMRALTQLHQSEAAVVLTSRRTMAIATVPSAQVFRRAVTLKTGHAIDPQETASRLTAMGYLRVPKVSVHGEFALRGEVLDVFLPGWDDPCRVVFDYDTISRIRLFDQLSQSSRESLTEITLYPHQEVTGGDTAPAELARATAEWSELRGRSIDEDAYRSMPLHWSAAGADGSILDFLHPSARMIWVDPERSRAVDETVRREYETVFAQEQFRRPLPRPDRVLRNLYPEHSAIQNRSITMESMVDPGDREAIHFTCDPPRSFFGNVTYLKEELSTAIAAGSRVFVLADTEAQQKRIEFLLRDLEIPVLPGSISGGFALPEQRLLVIQENEIFGRRRRAPASLKRTESAPIDTFVELEEGDFVVHMHYGIGVFRGISRLTAAGNERDYIKLEYADQETIFIPIEQVNLVQRYIGNEGNALGLDRIGGKSWEKRKERVRKSVEDLAEHLIKLYSRRRQAQGFAFPKDTDWQIEFEAAFPYEETPDQLTVVEEIKADMESPKPMDRLLCGDVGYGKTGGGPAGRFQGGGGGKAGGVSGPHHDSGGAASGEIPGAVRTVPRENRHAFPVRLRGHRKMLEKTAAGSIDILIGTHRIFKRM
jgi:transcription-repair coupling factor (superfamily II helicase)